MILRYIIRTSGAILLFSLFIISKVFSADDEIEILRQRLIDDALRKKGFIIRTERYTQTDFSKAGTYLSNLQANGSWSDVDYTDRDNEWNPLLALDRILVMTYAYRNSADNLYHQKNLLNGIESALRYWYQVNPICKNWYKNDIAKQFYFNVIALLLQNTIDNTLLDKMIADLTAAPSMTGSNRTLVSVSVLYRGVLEKNAERIASGVAGVMQQVQITPQEGIQADYSFHQHGPFLYNGSYGSNFLRETIWLASIVQGTSFAFTEAHMRILRDYYLEGTRWMIRNGTLDYNVRGRQVGRSSGFEPDAATIVPQLDNFIISDPAYRKQYQVSRERILHKAPQDIKGNRHFWRSDYTAHHRNAYFTSLKMCSQRTVGMEMDVNTENLYGYYLPYGFTYLYRRGDEYVDIFPVWDWARLPGVTSPHHAFSGKGRSSQPTSFVGGVSDSIYGVSTMDLDIKDTQAKKSWFWFDREWVALGAGIQAENENPIVTGVNQTLLKGNVVIDGTTFTQEEKTLENPSWVWHDSVAYVFPAQQTVAIKAAAQSGHLQRIFGLGADSVYQSNVFSLWFEHGLNPKEGSYQYIVVPGCGPSDMAAYTQNASVTVLANTVQIQAVTHRELQITGIVFHKAGSFAFSNNLMVEVSDPCLVLINHTTKAITVSDPTASLKKIDITLSIDSKESETKSASLPTGQFAGKSIKLNTLFKIWAN